MCDLWQICQAPEFQVTIGHGAILHACTIEDEVLVGMGAKILDGAIIRRGAIVGGGSVVAPGTEVPSGQVWAGCPARYLRDVDASESAFLAVSAHNYADLSREHWNEVTKVHMVRLSTAFAPSVLSLFGSMFLVHVMVVVLKCSFTSWLII